MSSKTRISTLVIALQRGRKRAFKSLYDMHVKQMLNVSYRMLADERLAEDAVQESFISCYQKIDQLSEPKAFSSWLKQIVIRTSLSKLKAKRFIYDEIDYVHVAQEDTESWYEEFTLQDIKKKVLELPEKSRAIFTLKAFEGLTHAEIADELHINISTSKSQYVYALQLLKKSLLKYRNHEV